MEINNHGKHLKVNIPSPNVTPKPATGAADAGGEVEQVKSGTLLERLQGDAKIREQLLFQIKAKFAAGEYATRAAAEAAAEQIVDPN